MSRQVAASALDGSAVELMSSIVRFQPQHALVSAGFIGMAISVLTIAVLHIRERDRWTKRERALTVELADLRGANDRAEMLTGSERQLIITWSGRDGEARFEGDPSTIGPAASPRRALAFGSWLTPADAAALEAAVARLKERGEAFLLTLSTTAQGFVEAEGRTLSGQALLRLRDVTGDRLERVRCERALAEASHELQSLHDFLDGIRQPVWLRDSQGRLAWANNAYVTAVEAKDVEDARARSLELLDQAARTEAQRKRQGGAPFQARVATVVAGARRVLDVFENASPSGAAAIAVDVSELEAVRADAQRQMEAHIRTLDQLPIAVAMFDAKQRLVFHNAAYRQLWNVDQSWLDSHPSDGEILDRLRSGRKLPEQADYRTWKANVLSAYRSAEPQETWWHLPDGRMLRVVANPHPQGGLTYLFDDVSDRVNLESQFNALIRAQAETLDALAEGVAVFGTDGRLQLCNRAFGEIWKLPPDTVDRQPHVDEVIKLCRSLAPDEEPWAEIRGAIAGLPDMRMAVNCRIERRDGSVFDCTAQPLPDGATLLTFIDATATVNVERALTEKNDALERASRLRDDFVHHISYELRSPLTNIIGFAQLLSDGTVGQLNPRQREYAGHIMRSSGALLAILNDILDLASIDNGVIEISREQVDIRATIEAAARGVEDRLAEASLTLDIDTPPDIGGFVADGKRVRQVLFNLLSNAVGFSSSGQTVRVTARKRDGEVLFEVADQGRGIPPEVKERVFERFESHTLGTRHRGVGLGLSIVRSLVELHGGRVELASVPGAGTTVTCVFPADGARERIAAE